MPSKSPSSTRRLRWNLLAAALGVAAGALPGLADAAPSLQERLAALEIREQRLDDHAAIEKLTRAYGYYVDKQLWDQVVDCFASDAVVEIAGRGVYHGHEGADRLFRQVMGGGQIGLHDGALFNHMILQGIVDVDAGGKTAHGRWRAFVQIAQNQVLGIWSEGTYENDYVKRDGVWQISAMHFYATYYTPFDQGWAKKALPNNGPSKDHAPDAPQSVPYDVFPGHYVPPFHYPNPVTGRAWTQDDTRRYSTTGMAPAPSGPPVQPNNPAPAPSAH